jgi:hypothetical protein
MKRYYLVRRNLETFLGPMSAEEVRQSFARLDFGPQDEVAGHCGNWVKVEETQKIRDNYPELSSVFSKNAHGTWGVSVHEGKRIQKRRKKRKPPSSAQLFMYAAIVGVLVGIGVWSRAAIFNWWQDRFAKGLSYELALSYIDDGDEATFMRYLQTHLPEVVTEAKSSKKAFLQWAPVLRAYAFWGDGAVAGLKPGLLRGGGRPTTPVNCSQASWRQRWRMSRDELRNLVDGQQLFGKVWVRVLLWEGGWIRWRSEPEGWKVPANFHAFCVRMAYRGFVDARNELLAVVSEDVLDSVESRLIALDEAQQSGTATLTPEVEDGRPLSVLTCLDRAANAAKVEECVAIANSAWSREWIEYVKTYRQVVLMRGLLSADSWNDESLLSLENMLNSSINSLYPLTQLELSPEIRYAKLLLLYRGNASSARSKLASEFPEIQFGKHINAH